MVNYNHYLEEIGIKKTEWPFATDNSEDSRYQPDEEGFVDAEFFSLDRALSMYIYSHLCYFRDNCSYGYPMSVDSMEEWTKIVNSMITAFRLMLEEEDQFHSFDKDEQIKYSKRRQRKINKGLRNFIKYYNNLWY